MSRVTDFSSDPRLGAYQRMLPPEEPKSAPVPPSETDKQAAASANGSTSQGVSWGVRKVDSCVIRVVESQSQGGASLLGPSPPCPPPISLVRKTNDAGR